MLNEYFSTCFNASVPPLSQLDEESQTHVEFGSTCSEDLLCTTEEVLSYIQTLDATKASGPDGISIRMLKHTATNIAPSLAKLFNISVKVGAFQLVGKLLLYLYQSHPNIMRLPTTDQYPFYRQ